MHRTNTSPISVEFLPTIMTGAKSFKGDTTILAGEKCNYLNTDGNVLITNYGHDRKIVDKLTTILKNASQSYMRTLRLLKRAAAQILLILRNDSKT